MSQGLLSSLPVIAYHQTQLLPTHLKLLRCARRRCIHVGHALNGPALVRLQPPAKVKNSYPKAAVSLCWRASLKREHSEDHLGALNGKDGAEEA